MLRTSFRLTSPLRFTRQASRSRNLTRLAVVGSAACIYSHRNAFAFADQALLAKPPIAPPAAAKPKSNKDETTSEFLVRKVKEIWRSILRFLYASKRVVLCSAVISSAAIIGPPALYFGKDEFLWEYIVYCIQYLGPTFIKLAQWASSRPDLFPESLTSHLERLQDSTVTYPWSTARNTLAESFGEDFEERLEVEKDPIGSGCIAQVYKGKLKNPDGTDQKVAIKLIHPHVRKLIAVDMDILRAMAFVFELFPSLEYLSMRDIVEEFAINMDKQNDLRMEARHLMKFQKNFEDQPKIIFPKPVQGYAKENALVETFHEGKSINEYMKKDVDKKLKLQLVDLCSLSLLEMVFKHNFVHGDLHPGNILVQLDKDGPKLVFIDCGIVTKVKKEQFRPMLDICLALLHYDGYKAGMLLADHSTKMSKEGLERFCTGVGDIVRRAQTLNYFEHLGGYLTEVCTLSCVNKVKVVPEFFQTAMSIKVAEGIALALDPTIEMAAVAIPVIVKSQAQYVMNKARGRPTIDDDDDLPELL
mmetsp:Transcript_5072/g.7749  ORF Transcript_5072/g.7749 Transcript_5072/m.7749 type:complete len:530 (+) Transcript_5072:110-1699(+)